MKDCPLCKESEEWKFSDTDRSLHDLFGFHKTLAESWMPQKGHVLEEVHDKIMNLFKQLKRCEIEISELKKHKCDQYVKIIGQIYLKK